MKKISSLFNRSYLFLVFFILFIHLLLNGFSFYMMKRFVDNNVLFISQFIKSFSDKFEDDVLNKVEYLEKSYNDIRKYIDFVDFSAEELAKYIKNEYKMNLDVAFISEDGIIYDTTYLDELGWNLKRFEDAVKAMRYVKTKNRYRIDYPVLNKNKEFYLYLLDYLPRQKKFIQLGYKLDLLNYLVSNFYFLKNIKNIEYSFDIFFVFKEGKDKIYSFANKKVITFDEIKPSEKYLYALKNMFLKSENELLENDLFNFKLYRVFNFSKYPTHLYSLAYVLDVRIVPLNDVLILLIVLNLLLIVSYFLGYRYFYKRMRTYIVKPISMMAEYISSSKPMVSDKFYIEEIDKLRMAYLNHLENIKLKDYVAELIKVQEKEREKIAKDIHDTVLQELNYLLINLNKKNDKESADFLKSVIRELRDIISENFPVHYKMITFYEAIEQFVDDCREKHPDFAIDVKMSDCLQVKLEGFVVVNIIRILNEIFNNAIYHSGGDSIKIHAYCKNRSLVIEVADNGVGFDVENEMMKKGHFGLVTIRERIYLLGGRFKVVSNRNGTFYKIEIPINDENFG